MLLFMKIHILEKLFLLHLKWLHISTRTIEMQYTSRTHGYINARQACSLNCKVSKRAMGQTPARTLPEAGVHWGHPPTALRPRRQSQETATCGQIKERASQPQCLGPANTSGTYSFLTVGHHISLAGPSPKFIPYP